MWPLSVMIGLPFPPSGDRPWMSLIFEDQPWNVASKLNISAFHFRLALGLTDVCHAQVHGGYRGELHTEIL